MPESNRELHITSRNFDEESALELLRTKSTVVAVHGRHDRDDPSTVYMGGKDAALIAEIAGRLQEAGFKTKNDNHPFPGIDDLNIVNRGLTGKGAQLEVPFSLRQRLANEPELLEKFCMAVRRAIETFSAPNGSIVS
ncbi:hypothetical protein AU467_02670 [Mesorhizobium loti]|uniref:Replication protein n=1 Tax=Rhizobium loti TaxID=381 RepID=A0A117N477_RHILI|nr:hypothetical protein AU467_02670 [Mesorhizobium loti]